MQAGARLKIVPGLGVADWGTLTPRPGLAGPGGPGGAARTERWSL